MDLSIITVTWNNQKTICEQIRSVVAGSSGISYEHIIVDNASTDDTSSLVHNFSDVLFIQNKKNAGFGAANNTGLHKSHGRYILFLNPDMQVQPGSLTTLVHWMDAHEQTAIASCKLVDTGGNYMTNAGPRRFPTVWDQFLLILKVPHLFPNALKRYMMADMDPDKEQNVNSVRGSCMFMRRSFIQELGFAFDPRYFIWFEDVDTCKEAQKRGLDVTYVPSVSCIDLVGRSFAQRDSVWKQKEFTQSMLQYFKKWHPWYQWIWIAAARPIGIAMVWVRERFTQ